MSMCKHCTKGSPGPNLSHSPLSDSTPLFLRGKELKIFSAETSSCWAAATDPSLS